MWLILYHRLSNYIFCSRIPASVYFALIFPAQMLEEEWCFSISVQSIQPGTIHVAALSWCPLSFRYANGISVGIEAKYWPSCDWYQLSRIICCGCMFIVLWSCVGVHYMVVMFVVLSCHFTCLSFALLFLVVFVWLCNESARLYLCKCIYVHVLSLLLCLL